jgi:hypothetical protein
MNPKPLPAKLYKYRVFNVNTLRLLTESKVYYANPGSFNDPLDCKPTISVDVERSVLECLYYKFLVKTERTSTAAKSAIADLRCASSEHGDYLTDDRCLKKLLAEKIMPLLHNEMANKGVFSLSETWQSPLMWSHYADEHRGICIEFDTTDVPHPYIGAVDYCRLRSVKASDIIDWKLQGSADAARRVYDTYFFAKAPEWKYEKEWRDIREPVGNADAGFSITSIYFGLKCEAAVITSVVKLLHSATRSIAFYQIYSRDGSFKLHRRQVDPNEVVALGVRSSAMLDFKDVIPPELC